MDKRQELLEALEVDSEDSGDSDDTENWELKSHHSADNVSFPFYPLQRKRSSGSEGRDRRAPRLNLDDALIKVVISQPFFPAC